MEAVLQTAYSNLPGICAAASGLLFILELITLRKMRCLKKQQRDSLNNVQEELDRLCQEEKHFNEMLNMQREAALPSEKNTEKGETETPENLIDAVLSEVFS